MKPAFPVTSTLIQGTPGLQPVILTTPSLLGNRVALLRRMRRSDATRLEGVRRVIADEYQVADKPRARAPEVQSISGLLQDEPGGCALPDIELDLVSRARTRRHGHAGDQCVYGTVQV